MAVQKVPFTLFETYENGKKRTLKFDTNALADFEQEVGMGFPTLMASRAVFAATRALAWSGLKHGDRRLSLADVGELIQSFMNDGHDITDVLKVCMEVATTQGALKPMVDDDAQEAVPTPRGTEGNELTPTNEPAN